MRFSSYIIGEGNKPGDILQDQQAVEQANLLNKQLKNYKNHQEDRSFLSGLFYLMTHCMCYCYPFFPLKDVFNDLVILLQVIQ